MSELKNFCPNFDGDNKFYFDNHRNLAATLPAYLREPTNLALRNGRRFPRCRRLLSTGADVGRQFARELLHRRFNQARSYVHRAIVHCIDRLKMLSVCLPEPLKRVQATVCNTRRRVGQNRRIMWERVLLKEIPIKQLHVHSDAEECENHPARCMPSVCVCVWHHNGCLNSSSNFIDRPIQQCQTTSVPARVGRKSG